MQIHEPAFLVKPSFRFSGFVAGWPLEKKRPSWKSLKKRCPRCKTPLVPRRGHPIAGCGTLWEHSYYIVITRNLCPKLFWKILFE